MVALAVRVGAGSKRCQRCVDIAVGRRLKQLFGLFRGRHLGGALRLSTGEARRSARGAR